MVVISSKNFVRIDTIIFPHNDSELLVTSIHSTNRKRNNDLSHTSTTHRKTHATTNVHTLHRCTTAPRTGFCFAFSHLAGGNNDDNDVTSRRLAQQTTPPPSQARLPKRDDLPSNIRFSAALVPFKNSTWYGKELLPSRIDPCICKMLEPGRTFSQCSRSSPSRTWRSFGVMVSSET